jgi:8-oxo-dGTP pyrophosphatase MutT (NUDIX family)
VSLPLTDPDPPPSPTDPGPRMTREPVDHEIPADALPEGFAENLESHENAPAEPRPAATVVLLRRPPPAAGPPPAGPPAAGGPAARHPAPRGLEVLLLRRARTSRFVPGAFVFPGGRVDRTDTSPSALAHLPADVLARLARRLGLDRNEAQAAGYLFAALRETFEETGILSAFRPASEPEGAASPDEAVLDTLRQALLDDRITMADLLTQLALDPALDDLAYIAHWVTPEAEPRRYDTRFFALRVGETRAVRVIPEEISEARWLAPAHALELHRTGELPMIFPTIRTLEELVPFGDPGEVLAHFRRREIPRILPRLVRTPTGVGIQVPDSR